MAVDAEIITTATVTDDSPVTIIADGADTACSADVAVDVGALSVGDRVTILVRNPRIPLITGIEVEA